MTLCDVVKEATNVGVHYKAEAFTVELENRLQSHMAVASLTEAKGRRMEQGFKDRIQEATNYLLGNPIADSGNAEGAKLRLIFRDEVASERVWLKRTLFQIPHQRPEIIGKVGLKHLDADLVDARGATVALDSLEAGQHQPVGDTSGEGVGFDDLGHEKSPVTIQPSSKTCGYWGCFLARSGLPERGPGGPFGGFNPTTNCPMTRQSIGLSLRFCVSFPSEGNYYRSAAIPEPAEPETASQVRRVADHFGSAL